MTEAFLLFKIFLAVEVGQVFGVDLLPKFFVGALLNLLEDHVGLEEAINQFLNVDLVT